MVEAEPIILTQLEAGLGRAKLAARSAARVIAGSCRNIGLRGEDGI
jgi:hypothetical protein